MRKKKMQKPIPGTRKVLVDIATHDDHGEPITDDMLSSGGARDRGPLVKQYTNPQPYTPAPARSAEATAQRNTMLFAGARWVWDEFGRDWWSVRGPQDLGRAGSWVKAQALRVRKPKAPVNEEPTRIEAQPAAEAEFSGPDEVEDIVADAPLAPVVNLEDFRRSA